MPLRFKWLKRKRIIKAARFIDVHRGAAAYRIYTKKPRQVHGGRRKSGGRRGTGTRATRGAGTRRVVKLSWTGKAYPKAQKRIGVYAEAVRNNASAHYRRVKGAIPLLAIPHKGVTISFFKGLLCPKGGNYGYLHTYTHTHAGAG